MSDTHSSGSVPQFGTAEYAGSPVGDTCKVCRAPLTGIYYRANGAMVCGSCAERVKREVPRDSHAAFVRGVLFGLGGFLAGLIAYSALGIMLRGWTIGYFALGVGWIVGKAIMAGSHGIGGRRYQMVAVLLTYAAVSMSAIPITLAAMKHGPAPAAQTSQSTQSSPEAGQPGDQPSAGAAQQPDSGAATGQTMSFARALGALAVLGLASPFLELQDGFGGVLMLVILFVGMRFAWRMTAGRATIVVDGPFNNARAASA